MRRNTLDNTPEENVILLIWSLVKFLTPSDALSEPLTHLHVSLIVGGQRGGHRVPKSRSLKPKSRSQSQGPTCRSWSPGGPPRLLFVLCIDPFWMPDGFWHKCKILTVQDKLYLNLELEGRLVAQIIPSWGSPRSWSCTCRCRIAIFEGATYRCSIQRRGYRDEDCGHSCSYGNG